jgi:CBS domain-containing protein
VLFAVQTSLTKLLELKGSGVVGLAPEASVKVAANVMREAKIGALLVMRGDRLHGILTERDILNKIVAEGLDASKIKVHEIMTSDVVVIGPNRTVREAMKIVTEKRLRHLPVVKDGHLVGVLSGGDLTRSIVAEEEDVIDTLYDYINGAYPG